MAEVRYPIVGGPHDGASARYVCDGAHETILIHVRGTTDLALYDLDPDRPAFVFREVRPQSDFRKAE
jgi:hypothetical protein